MEDRGNDNPPDQVVIAGIGAVAPVGDGRESTWRSSVGGCSGIAPVTAFEPSGPSAPAGGRVGRGDSRTHRLPPPPLRLSGADTSPIFRGWLHLAAFVAALPAGALLVRRSGDQGSVVLYAAALASLYGVSAAYHLLPMSIGARRWMRRMDHAVIYVFIAGAFTPFCLLVATGTQGRVLLVLMWIGAGVGVTIKLVSFERTRVVAGTLYILLGWLAIAMLPDVLRRLDATEVVLLFAMGALYTLGALVLAIRRPDPYPDTFGYHEVWHTMVVVATVCYYLVLWSLVVS